MYQYQGQNETITAISTPSGQGGIGIVRLSGCDALAIADKCFKARSERGVTDLRSQSINYGWIVKGDEIIDEVLLSVMRAPKSYTTEDVIEISCHGGMVSLRAILNETIAHGARLAEPGEFTKRAFLGGRIDLTQAEAVLDIIQSKTDAFLKVSTGQLKGDLSVVLEDIREALMRVYVELEAVVNFPEDEIDEQRRGKIDADIGEAKAQVKKLLASSKHGKILKEGIKIVLCGRPNVGKSSLLNVLLKTPRAIVSDIAGTTRDTIEETAQIQGIPFQLIDTAGILEPRDLIEEEAIKRSHQYIQQADLILLLIDATEDLSEADDQLIKSIQGQNILTVINKVDLTQAVDENILREKIGSDHVIKISTLNKHGVDQLEQAIVERVWHESQVNTHELLVSNIRHIESLKQCLTTIEKSEQILNEGISFEFISEEIKQAINSLDAVTGKNIDADLLDTIFGAFCIGK